uniref:Uncharacterized protein n=1 Tax=Sphaerodactylus townsendi TaxID=933632 RepID=A0ACB8GDQ4_9SAUR
MSRTPYNQDGQLAVDSPAHPPGGRAEQSSLQPHRDDPTPTVQHLRVLLTLGSGSQVVMALEVQVVLEVEACRRALEEAQDHLRAISYGRHAAQVFPTDTLHVMYQNLSEQSMMEMITYLDDSRPFMYKAPRLNPSGTSSQETTAAEQELTVEPRRPSQGSSPASDRPSMNSTPRHEEKTTWTGEDKLVQASSWGDSSMTPATFRTKNQKWTDEDTELIQQDVRKFGEGRWKQIREAYDFKNLTAVMLKDRWRTIKKMGLCNGN